MMTLKDKVMERAKFSVAKFLYNAGYDNDKPLNSSEEWCVRGAESQQKQMLPLIEALASEVERLRSELSFYADYMNYSIDYDTSNHGFSRRCILYSDIEEKNEATGLAGKRARQALSEPSPLDALLEGDK